jgi:hypothetical protein
MEGVKDLTLYVPVHSRAVNNTNGPETRFVVLPILCSLRYRQGNWLAIIISA